MEMDRKEAKKQILISIIISYWPLYEHMEHPYIKPYGYYDPLENKWFWNRMSLSELRYDQLYDILLLVAPEKVYLVSLRIKDL
jgi:hypothetical protein